MSLDEYQLPFEQPEWAKDEPSMLRTVPDRRIELDQKCPNDGRNLVAIYEADTNACHSVHCPNPDCDYREED
jgi:hypothetical protein